MKKNVLRIITLLAVIIFVAACSSNDNSSDDAKSKVDNKNSSVEKVLQEQKDKNDSSNDKKDNKKDKDNKDTNAKDKDKKDDKNKSSSNDKIDVDLSTLNKNLIYAQVYSIMTEPDKYEGKIIKMKGAFSVYKDKKTYFSCIIKDATECCSQGIEFVWKGDHKYPNDYPKENDEITVVGKFNTYKEGNDIYCQLIDADLSF